MLARLSGVLYRRRRLVWIGAVLFVVVAGGLGTGVQKHLKTGGFEDTSAESTQAKRILSREFGQQDPNLVMVVTATSGTVDDAAVAQAGNELTTQLSAEKYISFAGSYWSLGSPPPLKSTNGQQALLLARIKGSDTQVDKQVDGIIEKYNGVHGPIKVDITGQGPVFHEVGKTIEDDLKRAETLALGITVVLLVLVFGGLVAASLPLTIGIIAIVGSWLALRVIASITGPAYS